MERLFATPRTSPVFPSNRPATRRVYRGRYRHSVRAFAHDLFTYPLPPGHRFPLASTGSSGRAPRLLPGVSVEPARRATRGARARPRRIAGCASSPEAERAHTSRGARARAALVARAGRACATLDRRDAHGGRDRTPGGSRGEPRRRNAPRVPGRRPGLLRVQRRRHGDPRPPSRSGASRGCWSSTSTSTRVTERTRSFRGDPESFTFSINGFRELPVHARTGDLELDLSRRNRRRRVPREPSATPRRGDRPCPARPASTSPEPTRTRATGSAVSRSPQGRVWPPATHSFVMRSPRREYPVCVTLAGGYADPITDTVAINLATIDVFAHGA